ncbi:MAG: hypothetical protein MAG458_01570 [Nitrosopumilus sp.]|nr:hypothetical protein [Nitrosopumilus sp.]
MQKNTKTLSISAIIAIVAIASVSLTTVDFSSQQTELETQETIVQTISGSMPAYTLEELASGTKYAIIGTVKQITPIAVESERMQQTIFSDVVVKVKEDLNGLYDQKEISVRIQGGTIDNLQTISEPSAEFEVGEKVLFFVADKEPDSMWGDNYYVAGGYLGKYKLDDNGNAHRDKINDSIGEQDLVSKIKKFRGN